MNSQCRIEAAPAARELRVARPRPADFEIIFVEQGRLECETWYHCRRTTVDRWLEEGGKAKLIAKRAAFVKLQREQRRAPKPTQVSKPAVDRRRVSPALARKAAHFLRCVRNGGWIISPTPDGDWWVGTRRRSPAELVDLASQKGFDRKAANLLIQAEAVENEPCPAR